MNHVLWKVRNRLIVTYLLMGLAPVVLFATLSATIAAYVFSGQFATFAATSELESALGRLSAENQAFAVHVAHVIARAPSANSVELADYDVTNHGIPGRLLVDAWVGSQTDNRHLLLIKDGRELPQHNTSDPITYPDWLYDGFHGIVIDDGRLFLRAVNERTVAGNKVTFVSSAPLDPATVDQLAQGLGLIQIAPGFGRAIAEDDGKAPRNRSKRVTPRDLASQTAGTVNGGKLAPPAFYLDRRITFSTLFTATEWGSGKKLTGLMSVTSRPALLYAQLFGTAVELGTFVRYALIILAVLFALLELVAFVMAVRLNRTITRAVGDLYRATTAIDSGNFAYRIQVQRRDQLGALSTSFNTMSESLERLLIQQREKERMQSELEIAQEVQNNLFPQGEVAMPGLELHGVCKPARTVSGDYYDFLIMGESELTLAMGDISGKGISAALLMASLHSAVRAYRFAGEDCFDDSGTARHLSTAMSPSARPARCSACSIAISFAARSRRSTPRCSSRTTTPIRAACSTPTAASCRPSCSAPMAPCAAWIAAAPSSVCSITSTTRRALSRSTRATSSSPTATALPSRKMNLVSLAKSA